MRIYFNHWNRRTNKINAQFELAYYGCDSVIPVVIPSKLKISFQARKSPSGA